MTASLNELHQFLHHSLFTWMVLTCRATGIGAVDWTDGESCGNTLWDEVPETTDDIVKTS
uniref:Uncharacterized protein n=1 Tax=Arundo donax TaxID=35708 RepID=A0A0A8YYY4_ARUDO